jgi:hypothetical protein
MATSIGLTNSPTSELHIISGNMPSNAPKGLTQRNIKDR